MTRHSKNATAGPTYTYHEKVKDCKQSGYGTKEERLSKDAIKDFDCCSLSLQPCKNPVITPDGWIYEKESILEYILHKKVENARLMKLYEKQKEETEHDGGKSSSEALEQTRLEKFLKSEGKLVGSLPLGAEATLKKAAASTSNADDKKSTITTDKASVSNMKGDLSKKLPSFWIPELVPSSKTKSKIEKPDNKIYCPMSKIPISMKDLIEVKFKRLAESESLDRKSLIARTERYVCSVTNDVLGNSVQCVVLRTSGAVVTAECAEKVIKKDMIDPINGKKMTDKDIIYIQRGGTGYAGSGVSLISKKVGPAMQS